MKKQNNEATTEFTVDNDKLLPSDEDLKRVEISDNKILDEAKQKMKEQSSRRTKIFNIAFFLVNIAVLVIILIVQLNRDGISNLGSAIGSEVGIRYLFLALGAFAAIMLVDSLRTFILIHKSTGRVMPLISYKSTAMEKYYDSITPLSVGGQPFMIYYLSRWKIKASTATSIPMARLVYSQLAFVVVSIVILFTNLDIFNSYQADANVVYVISIVALCLICLLILSIFVLSYSKVVAPKLVMGVLKLGHKMHLVRDYEASFENIMRHVLEYQKSMKYFAKSLPVSIVSFILSAGIYFLKALVPFCIYLAMTPVPVVSYFSIFARIILCELVAHIIPFPGGAGMVEFSFSTLFASLFLDGTLFWAMLFYRLFSYYIYLLQGFCVMVYDFAIGNRRRTNRPKRLERRRIKKIERSK